MTKIIAWIAVAVLISVLFFEWGFPKPILTAVNAINTGVYDADTLGGWGDPNRPLKQQYRNGRRSAVNQMSQTVSEMEVNNPLKPGGTSADDYYKQRLSSAIIANQYRQREEALIKTTEGRTVAEITSIDPRRRWTPTGKEVRTKTRVIVHGQINSCADCARDEDLNVWTDADGWPNPAPEGYRKFGLQCNGPYMGICGRIRKDDGSYTAPFFIGKAAILDPEIHGAGQLEIGPNEFVTDQFGNPIASMFDHNQGGLSYEIKPM